MWQLWCVVMTTEETNSAIIALRRQKMNATARVLGNGTRVVIVMDWRLRNAFLWDMEDVTRFLSGTLFDKPLQVQQVTVNV